MRRDVHPAEVLTSDGRLLTGVRAFVTTERLIVVGHDQETDAMDRLVDVQLEEHRSVEGDGGTLGQATLEVRTVDGLVIVNQGYGCGCGSPLKRLGLPVPWRAEQAASVG